ncbi:hypothetical protein CDAR_194001 [Caerostris darwini]|uniref:Uncharacterized protein n=1 Tax=Caerostris darwini TaxID=1538125 RepID=A0AAV4T337_9ARAC|nr:hypothetical protein CDAR_194001 [Caerostris darwini]
MAERVLLFHLKLFRILKQNKHLNSFPLYHPQKIHKTFSTEPQCLPCLLHHAKLSSVPCKMSNPTPKQKKSRDEKTRCSPKKNIPRFAPGHCGRVKGAGGKVHFFAKKNCLSID